MLPSGPCSRFGSSSGSGPPRQEESQRILQFSYNQDAKVDTTSASPKPLGLRQNRRLPLVPELFAGVVSQVRMLLTGPGVAGLHMDSRYACPVRQKPECSPQSGLDACSSTMLRCFSHDPTIWKRVFAMSTLRDRLLEEMRSLRTVDCHSHTNLRRDYCARKHNLFSLRSYFNR